MRLPPLIGLAKIGHLQLLKQLYHTVLIPPTVRAELKPESNYQGADALKAALDDSWLVVAETPAVDLLVSLQQILDPGEAEAIALAQQSEGASLIIDERRGRSVATHRKIKIIGTGVFYWPLNSVSILIMCVSLCWLWLRWGYQLSPQLRERLLVMAGE